MVATPFLSFHLFLFGPPYPSWFLGRDSWRLHWGIIIWESSHLIKWSNLNVVFNICFSLFLIVFVYCILIGLWILICYYMIWILTNWLNEILNPRIEDMLMTAISVISAWDFSGCFAGEGLGAYRFYSLHTYTFHAYFLSGILKPRIWKKHRIRGIQWYRNGCTSYSGFHENPS